MRVFLVHSDLCIRSISWLPLVLLSLLSPFLSSFPLQLLGSFHSSPDITEATLNWSSVSDWVLQCALHRTHRTICDMKRWSFCFPESHRLLSRSCFRCWHQYFWKWFYRYMSVLKDVQWFQYCGYVFVVGHSLSCVWLFATAWTVARQTPLSFTISSSLLRFMSIELVMLSNHLILCCPLHLLPSGFPSIRVFSNESVLIRWPKYWSFSFSISPSNEYSGLISLRIDCFDLLAVQGTFKSLLQHHSSNVSSLQSSSFFMLLILHTRTWLMQKPYLWLCGPLLANWCLCFLIGCPG